MTSILNYCKDFILLKQIYFQSVLFGFLSLFLIKYGILPAWSKLPSDFHNYYAASRILIEGEDVRKLYDDEWFNKKLRGYGIEDHGKFSTFPPSTAFIMVPMAKLEPLIAKRVWIIINIIFLAINILLLQRITGWTYLWSANFILLCGIGLANNFRFGQIYLILSGLVLLSYYLWYQKRQFFTGILLGLCTSIKYFPIVFIAAFLYNRKWNVVMGGVLSILIISFIEIYFFGWVTYYRYISGSLLPHMDGLLSDQNPFAFAFQSWNSLLRNIFVYDRSFNTDPLVDWSTGYIVVKIIIYSLIIGWTLYTISLIQKLKSEKILPINLAFFGITAMVLLPASATYHTLFLIFPVAIFLSQFKKSSFMTISCYAAIGFIPLNYFYQFDKGGIQIIFAYPRLWLLSMMFVVMSYFIYHEIIDNLKSSKKIINYYDH